MDFLPVAHFQLYLQSVLRTTNIEIYMNQKSKREQACLKKTRCWPKNTLIYFVFSFHFDVHDTSDEWFCILTIAKLLYSFNIGNVKLFGKRKGLTAWIILQVMLFLKDWHRFFTAIYRTFVPRISDRQNWGFGNSFIPRVIGRT